MAAVVEKRGGLAWALAGPALALMCLVACSPRESLKPEHGPLYTRILEYRAEYENGLEVILAGDAITGENLLAAASKRLSVAARQCAETPGCDFDLFLETAADLAREQRREHATTAIDPELAAETKDPTSSPLVSAIPEMGRTVSMLHGTDLRELIPMNRRVKAALGQWLARDRADLLEAWENYQYLRADIAPIYHEAGLPEALLFAMLAKETGTKAHAYSTAGAVGPLQFMPRTAMRYGLRTVDGFDLRLDPIASTRANVAYLDDQFRGLNYNLELTLAAYNSGETRVRRLHRRDSDAEFWDPSVYYSLPRETQDYVPMILAAAWLFLHPDEYGLEFPPIESGSTSIRLSEPISVDELTVCLGQEGNPRGWYRTLRNLNPRLRSGERAPAGASIQLPTMLVESWAERCVGDAPGLALARELHAAENPDNPEAIRYTVRRGDTLASIAARHRVSIGTLAAINGLKAPNYVIHVGQSLEVPQG